MMRSFIATVLSASFTLQLLLAGSTVCAMPHGESASSGEPPQTMESAAMAGMELSPSYNVARLGSDGESSSSDEAAAPCDEPASRSLGYCAATCSAMFTLAMSVPSHTAPHDLTRALPTPALEPRSRSESPEPPPPRG